MRHLAAWRITLAICCLCAPPLFATDMHWLWDDRCAECHGHSAAFARKFLYHTTQGLHGPHHRDLRRFLQNHYTPPGEVDRIYRMLQAQTQTPAHWQTACFRCHAQAADFVRSRLQWRDDELVARDSGRDVAGFMREHRGLEAEEIEFYLRLLRRIAGEVYGGNAVTNP